MHNAAKISAALSVLVNQLFVVRMKLIFTIVGLISLHETPSVYVDDLAFATVVASKQIKATDSLSKALGYLISPRLLFFREPGNESKLLMSTGWENWDKFTGSLSLQCSVGRPRRQRATSGFPRVYIHAQQCKL